MWPVPIVSALLTQRVIMRNGKKGTKGLAQFLCGFPGDHSPLSAPNEFPGLLFFYHGHMPLVKRSARSTSFNHDLVIRFFFPEIRNIFNVIT